MSYQYRVLIGGIGDDAHSVGIGLIELGFREAGFYVKSLGIRNKLESFFEYAPHFDIFLISNKNGHAEFYLQDFPRLFNEYALQDDSKKLWYLGGSLSVNETDFQIKKKFLHMGFTNVYPRPISFDQVLEDINRDIYRNEIPERKTPGYNEAFNIRPKLNLDNIIDRQLTREELDKERTEVLMQWPTGKEVSGEAFTMPRPSVGTLDDLLWKNKTRKGVPLFQPRTGVADVEEQIQLLQYLESEGSDISSVQLDAACRSLMYDKASLGIQMSKERKASQLNGFPIPIYGVKEVRRLVHSLKNPFQLRGGGPDHRFTYEIALRAGISGVEGGFICYCMPYDKTTSPLQALNNWHYIDRLCALYKEDYGITINREYFGVLTATLIEPSIAIVVNIIQALLSAQQGITSITVGYAEQGNRVQDIAAIQVMEESVNHYLKQHQYWGCRVTTVFHQFMAAFPSSYEKAEELIFNSSITATLSGATKVMVKTAMEAIKIPDRYDNAKAVKVCKKGAPSRSIPKYLK
jgi:methylaspartate mutase epsilon subunit